MWRTILWAALTFGLDRVAKLAAERLLEPGTTVNAIENVLVWTLTRNNGIAFGAFGGSAVVSLLLPLLAVAVGAVVLLQYRHTSYTRIAVGLLLGGFLGNYIDRLLYGYVTDMIYFPWMPWFVCNVADIAICTGVAMLGVSLLFRPQDWRKRNAKDDDHSVA